MEVRFSGTVFEWRGPAPFHFVALAPDTVDAIAEVAAHASYGWGCIPVTSVIGDTTWTTSLIPKDGGYYLPLKDKVRKVEAIADGDLVEVELHVQVWTGGQRS